MKMKYKPHFCRFCGKQVFRLNSPFYCKDHMKKAKRPIQNMSIWDSGDVVAPLIETPVHH